MKAFETKTAQKIITTPDDILALKSGSYPAYNKIYLAWHGPVFNMLRRLTGSTDEAEDIAQEVFINLWEYRGKLDPEKKISTFLFTVAKRAAIDLFRHKKAEGEYINMQDWDNLANEASDSRLIEKEIHLLKELALSRMPEYRRNIYHLSHVEGLNNDEIAQKLNIKKESVYTQLSIARKQLRELIKYTLILLLFHPH